MEVTWVSNPVRIGCERIGSNQNFFARCDRIKRDLNAPAIKLRNLELKVLPLRHRRDCLELLQACRDSRASIQQSDGLYNSFDANWPLQTKGQEVAAMLNGRCIFLIGMMGSGKTTVGKVLAEALGYTFVDSDKYVEEATGGVSVAEIFQNCGESFFRDVESQALQKLCSMPQQVIATGGGIVTRSVNWEYMRQGITVFLNVPLDTLARRIAAVGTESRPLLRFNSGDPYTKAFVGLFTLAKKRNEAYSNADTSVSLSEVADNFGLEDACDLTPHAIAIAVLGQVDNYLRGNSRDMSVCSLQQ